jgi:hypothetical protein
MGEGMNINLVTDAPKNHNLALMKISTYYKNLGFNVKLNNKKSDLTIGSYLFNNSKKSKCDIFGGPGINPSIKLPEKINNCKPDYNLFPTRYSIGYTWSYCPRKCVFCIVPKQNNKKIHNSVFDFYNGNKFICLLNNNTFSDPQWKETFEEILSLGLIIKDENGYDLRLVDEEKAFYLKILDFEYNRIHYAWDDIKDEKLILNGLKLVPKGIVYVLIGFNSTVEEDFHRCQKINDMKFDPYIMPYNGGTRQQRNFKRFIDSRMYRKYKTLKDAWSDWRAPKYMKNYCS